MLIARNYLENVSFCKLSTQTKWNYGLLRSGFSGVSSRKSLKSECFFKYLQQDIFIFLCCVHFRFISKEKDKLLARKFQNIFEILAVWKVGPVVYISLLLQRWLSSDLKWKKDLTSGIKEGVGRGGGTEIFETKYIFQKKS